MRRGQVALEFLATYGWALLVVLSMIATLSYFGISNPTKLLPARCTVGAELSCDDFKIDGQAPGMFLHLRQGVGKTIFLEQLTCTFHGNRHEVELKGKAWPPSEAIELVCLDDPALASAFSGLAGAKAKAEFEIVYKKSQGGFDHLVSGELYAPVQ